MPNKETVRKAAEKLIEKKSLEILVPLLTDNMPTVKLEPVYVSKNASKVWQVSPEDYEKAGITPDQVKLIDEFSRANKLRTKDIIDTVKRDKFLHAYVDSMGNASEASRVTGIRTNYHYIWKLIYPEYQADCETVTNTMLDIAERELFKHIRSGNLTSIIFYLKCLGKSRGYIDRVMVDNGQLVSANQLNINVTDKETKTLMNDAIKMINGEDVPSKIKMKGKSSDKDEWYDQG